MAEGYLKWSVATNAMNHLLKIYDHDFYRYNKISTQIYSWLNVTNVDLSYEKVNNMTTEKRSVFPPLLPSDS